MRYFRGITGKERTNRTNEHLGLLLAFVAGAVNAGGFLAISQYTSHMTGIVSQMADALVLGQIELVLSGVAAVVSFIVGAAISSILINWGRRHQLHSVYALSLMLEAMLLLCFGLVGSNISQHIGFHVSMTVMLLSLIMGIQNAIITKISNSSIRTTHVTGTITDIGIELGKMLYWNSTVPNKSTVDVKSNRSKLRLLSHLVLMFFVGGVTGAFGFKSLGFSATIPLSIVLMFTSASPILDDLNDKFSLH